MTTDATPRSAARRLVQDALESIQWACEDIEVDLPYCPSCGQYEADGHDDDCRLGCATAADAVCPPVRRPDADHAPLTRTDTGGRDACALKTANCETSQLPSQPQKRDYQ